MNPQKRKKLFRMALASQQESQTVPEVVTELKQEVTASVESPVVIKEVVQAPTVESTPVEVVAQQTVEQTTAPVATTTSKKKKA